SVQIENKNEGSALDKFVGFNLASPALIENKFAKVKSRKDILLENENGLRLEDGYNIRIRLHPWVNLGNFTTFSATPAFRFTEFGTELFLDEAAAKFSLFNTELSASKSAMWWGPGFHGSMLISNNAKALNLVRLRSINSFYLPWMFKNLGSFGINFFIGQLEKDRTIPAPRLAGLRLEWSPLPYLVLGANRTAIMGGEGRPKPLFNDYVKM
ncbi:MAG: capsule assembly Wzi family protein, partial [Candidatus Omnitrophica bacterium]|nr:capsule assembly Wzi family protein [Candidatus Omnitrophota bacterium]